MIKQVLTSIALFASFATFAQGFNNEENKRNDSVRVSHYTLHLDFTSNELIGKAIVTIEPTAAGFRYLPLDLLSLAVDSVHSDGSALNYSYDGELLMIDLGSQLQSGTKDVVIEYHGSPVMDQTGWGGYYHVNDYKWNLGVGFGAEPHNYGRPWHPCFDNFRNKATYSYFITVPSSQRAIANGHLMNVSAGQAPNTMVYEWEMNHAIPTYLAAFNVAPYETVHQQHNGIAGLIPIELNAKAQDTTKLKASFIHLPDAIDAYEYWYGEHRFEKVGYSLVPFNGGAMEHATNIAYPVSAADGGTSRETLMAHELAHHWWGDWRTCLTPEDMWLNEGWASYSEALFLERTYGRERMLEDLKATHLSVIRYAHIQENGYRAVSGVPHSYTYGRHVYDKGSLVAHNLRGYLGDQQFRAGLLDYMSNDEHMTSWNFEQSLTNSSGQDMSSFFQDWVFTGGWSDIEIESFKVTATAAPEYMVELGLQQKVKGKNTLHTNIPVEVGFMTAGGQWYYQQFMLDSSMQTFSITYPEEVIWAVVDPRELLMDGTTSEDIRFEEDGVVNSSQGLMQLTASNVSDSFDVRLEHHWVAADALREQGTKPYRISQSRYWRVLTTDLAGAQLSGRINYDGRESGGYLDSGLVNITEDSLVLLYRATPEEDWTIYPHYTKNTLGASTPGFGLLDLSEVMPGEYALANIDHTAMSVDDGDATNDVRVYPNPTQNILHFDWQDLEVDSIEIFNLTGQRMTIIKTGRRTYSHQLSLASWPRGTYLYLVHFKNGHSQDGVIQKI